MTERAVRFPTGDPGKHVQSLIPSFLWKAVRRRCDRDGLTISHAIGLALTEWVKNDRGDTQ